MNLFDKYIEESMNLQSWMFSAKTVHLFPSYCFKIPIQYTVLKLKCYLFRYLKYTLDQYVENDYTVVYFHYGLKSLNKPSLKWLQTAYKEFDRKYVSRIFGLCVCVKCL